MKKILVLLVTLMVIALASGAYAQSGDVTHASAVLKDTKGHEVGIARFTQDEKGIVHINATVKGLSPGLHGIHIHQYGTCSPNFAAAGEHYNPLGKMHGLKNPKGPHAGDLPNLKVDQSGVGNYNTTTSLVTLSPGKTSLFNGNGTTLVIHAGPDDQMTNPSGNSGDRIACGVIKAT